MATRCECGQVSPIVGAPPIAGLHSIAGHPIAGAEINIFQKKYFVTKKLNIFQK